MLHYVIWQILTKFTPGTCFDPKNTKRGKKMFLKTFQYDLQLSDYLGRFKVGQFVKCTPISFLSVVSSIFYQYRLAAHPWKARTLTISDLLRNQRSDDWFEFYKLAKLANDRFCDNQNSSVSGLNSTSTIKNGKFCSTLGHNISKFQPFQITTARVMTV